MATKIARKPFLNFKSITRNFSKPAAGASQQHAGGMDLWKKLSLFGALPAVGILTLKTVLDIQHDHDEPPPFVPYDHLRIRNKRFPWGDGNKSLFHNPHTNPLPTGYEH